MGFMLDPLSHLKVIEYKMITILGASGFIGSNIVNELNRLGVSIFTPKRDEELHGLYLGHVIYCIGLTADAKFKHHETVTAHITKLQEIIIFTKYDSITYCSSTRLYINNLNTQEYVNINVNINDSFELFNLTKLTAELLLKNTVKNYKIVRLSNIFGYDFDSENFITSIVRDSIEKNKIILRTTPDSSKDFLFINDAVNLIIKIATNDDAHGIYNVAYGANTTNFDIMNIIGTTTNSDVKYEEQAKSIKFPTINVEKIKNEFNFYPTNSILNFLPNFINKFKEKSY